MKRNTRIEKVSVLTVGNSMTAYVYYVSGKHREFVFNEISELPQTVQSIIIGNENTVVTETSTTFYNTEVMEDRDITRDVSIASEWSRNVSVKGDNLSEWNILMIYLSYYTDALFRVAENNRVYVNMYSSHEFSWFESISKNSLLASAVTKYIGNDILKGRIEAK